MAGTPRNARDWIETLELQRHPEGGWFRETYRAVEGAGREGLPPRFGGPRSFATSILYLLPRGEFSALHRLRSDELWHFHAGAPLAVSRIERDGRAATERLGAEPAAGDAFQRLVPAGCWFGAELAGEGGFSLVGCTVAPGFEAEDFELGDRGRLLAEFPAHRELILRLTR